MPPISINIDNPSPDEIAMMSKVSAALSGGAIAAPGTTTTTGSDTPSAPSVPAVDYFPANPALAPFPSPENAAVTVYNGQVATTWTDAQGVQHSASTGYLRDKTGVIYEAKVVRPVTATDNGAQLFIAGQALEWLGKPYAVMSMLVRQSAVYFTEDSGTHWEDNAGGIYNTALPQPFVTGAGGSQTPATPQLPTLPADPKPSAVAPGSSGTVILVGPSQTLKTLADAVAVAKPGDTIRLDKGAVFAESVAVRVPVLIDGQGAQAGGGAKIDGTNVTAMAEGKGGLVCGADVIVKGLEVTGWGMFQQGANGTGGIRPTDGCGYLTVQDCYIHGNQNGIASGGIPMVWKVSDTTFDNNGLPAGNSGHGATHNMYLSDTTVRVELTNVTSGNANGGHAVKCRAAALKISGGKFFAAAGAIASVIDIPNGGTAPFVIDGAEIDMDAGALNHTAIGYGLEYQNLGLAGGKITGAKFNLNCDGPNIMSIGGPISLDSTCTFSGNKLTAVGGGAAQVTGLPA